MPKVISERTLDNKTIQINEKGDAIEVKVASGDDNLVQVTEDGIKVAKPNTIKLKSLGGQDLGDLIV